jgi:hypothetical protein
VSKDIDKLDWLQKIRRKIAANCHNDPKLMGDYYRSIQKQFENRLIKNSLDEESKINMLKGY